MNLTKLKLKPHKLLQHLDELVKFRDGEYFPPVYVELSCTDRCNQKCPYCYTDYLGHKKIELEKEIYLRIMGELGGAGVKSLFMQGTGEPLFNKTTPDAIVAAKKSGVDVALQSNGVLFLPEAADKCLSSLSLCRFSAIESNEKRYSRTHGCDPKQFNQLVNNVKHAVRLRNSNNLETVIASSLIVFDYNAPCLYDTIKMWKDIGLDYIQIKPAQISSRNPDKTWNKNIYDEIKDKIDEIKKMESEEFIVDIRLDQFRVLERGVSAGFIEKFDKCYGVEFETVIDADACVYPCYVFWRNPEYRIGDLHKSSFEEIWKSERKREVFDKLYNEYDIKNCAIKCCKQCNINADLTEIRHPPMHRNFI